MRVSDMSVSATDISVSATEAAKQITMTVRVKVTHMRLMRARIWIGSRIMMAGAWVIGVGRCKIVEEGDGE